MLIAKDLCATTARRWCSAASASPSPPGPALGIVGPDGIGKSTLLGILAGVDVPADGAAEVIRQIKETRDTALEAPNRSDHHP